MAPRSYLESSKAALRVISERTRTPLPSLVFSFAILHELTAFIPLVAIFYTSRSLGIGERVVDWVRLPPPDPSSAALASQEVQVGYVREKVGSWVDEGERWAGRVGKKYGFFGIERQGSDGESNAVSSTTPGVAGGVADAVVAYGATKALMPLRVGASLYLAPAFSRRVVEPTRKFLFRVMRRR